MGEILLRGLCAEADIQQELPASRQSDEEGAGLQRLRFHGFALLLQAQGGQKLQAGLLPELRGWR